MCSVVMTAAWDQLCSHERSVSTTDVIRNSNAMQLFAVSKTRTLWQMEPFVIFIKRFSAAGKICNKLIKVDQGLSDFLLEKTADSDVMGFDESKNFKIPEIDFK